MLLRGTDASLSADFSRQTPALRLRRSGDVGRGPRQEVSGVFRHSGEKRRRERERERRGGGPPIQSHSHTQRQPRACCYDVITGDVHTLETRGCHQVEVSPPAGQQEVLHKIHTVFIIVYFTLFNCSYCIPRSLDRKKSIRNKWLNVQMIGLKSSNERWDTLNPL